MRRVALALALVAAGLDGRARPVLARRAVRASTSPSTAPAAARPATPRARAWTAERCLRCHTALSQRIAAGRGLHARADYRACERCHIEHHGRDFDLVFWGEAGRAAFDHGQTGFPLAGRHAQVACTSCHAPKHVRDGPALSRGGVNLARTFLGLERACSTCHADPHRGQFAPRACADCHAPAAWKPAAFDHDRAAFPLTGKHEAVACASCHKPGPDGTTSFKGVAHQTCASCHRDPHAGRLGASCATCHTTAGFTRIEPGRFDHARTRFPLTGRHARVGCDGCHRAANGEQRFAGTPFATCASCHRDPHAGRLGAECTACHTTAGFAQVAPGKFDHARTRFPLRGRHAAVACASCHRSGQPRAMAHARCADCHADRHAGQLAGTCESCHDVDGFVPARFTPEDHAKTGHPLQGAHLAVPCDACHREVPTAAIPGAALRGAPVRTEQFRFASTGCAACHADPHGGKTARFGGCDGCHRPDAWAQVAFDHARTGFALADAHTRVSCRACHPGAGGALAFSGRPRDCAGCHRDPHDGHFAKSGRTECARCHDPTVWTRVRFDHDRDTAFPLQGAHRAVPCAKCHRRTTPTGETVRYTGLGRACGDCHAASPPAPRGGGG